MDGLPPGWRPFRELSLDELQTLVNARSGEPGWLAAVHFELGCRSGMPGQIALQQRIEKLLKQPTSQLSISGKSATQGRLGSPTRHSLPAGGSEIRTLPASRSGAPVGVHQDHIANPQAPMPEWLKTVLGVAAVLLLYRLFF